MYIFLCNICVFPSFKLNQVLVVLGLKKYEF